MNSNAPTDKSNFACKYGLKGFRSYKNKGKTDNWTYANKERHCERQRQICVLARSNPMFWGSLRPSHILTGARDDGKFFVLRNISLEYRS